MEAATIALSWGQLAYLTLALFFGGGLLLVGVLIGGWLRGKSYEPLVPHIREQEAKAFNLPADEGLKEVEEAFHKALGPGAFNVPGEGEGAPDADSMPPSVRDASHRIDAMFSGQIEKEEK